jgi:hypothetical protein
MALLSKLITHPRGIFYILFFYFIVAVAFSFLYFSLIPALENNESLRFLHSKAPYQISYIDCLYFSITSQATVGYGDIIPITNLAKILVSLQVFFGYFYLCFSISIFTARAVLKSKKNIYDSKL